MRGIESSRSLFYPQTITYPSSSGSFFPADRNRFFTPPMTLQMTWETNRKWAAYFLPFPSNSHSGAIACKNSPPLESNLGQQNLLISVGIYKIGDGESRELGNWDQEALGSTFEWLIPIGIYKI
jgi:hypothetical protein